LTRVAVGIGTWLAAGLLGLVILALTAGAALAGSRDIISFSTAWDGDLDIYLLDIGRQMTFNLTRDPQTDWGPAWSPDGKQIAFVSDRDGNRDLYIMNVGCRDFFTPCDGHIRRLTDDAGGEFDPAWSPDGQQIAYVSEMLGYEIMVVAAGGGIPQQLTHNPGLDANPAWSPDGQNIAFSSDRDTTWETDLYVMEADGGNVRRVLDNPDHNDALPVWSPDGRRLLYVTGNQAYRQVALLDLDSGRSTPLLDQQGDDDMPAWSPRGESLVLVSFREGYNGELYTLRLDCTGAPETCLRRLTFNAVLETYPRWQPVGATPIVP
jgi:Tol biopolymer transport system component